MKFFFNLLIMTLMLAIGIRADLRYRGNAVHPDYPGQCYYEDLQQPIPVSQSFKPINRDGRCESIYCRNDFVLEIGICPRHNMQETDECSIVSDLTKAYPDCCPKYVCKKAEDNFI
ncbi:uncharacterized protein LOC119643601 [Glossina fuscipes]|uniref:Uncharacterized protein LOC119643601 n=2 Tax=Glossina TaxID=7393 RepID=A0A9C5ZLG7_9MUSC|nr:uncharacterized protein LOC119643601 [Glossina fuscipes]KAI9588949.1 hypothetical protein GQX74_007118 [Glossina fuscipes]